MALVRSYEKTETWTRTVEIHSCDICGEVPSPEKRWYIKQCHECERDLCGRHAFYLSGYIQAENGKRVGHEVGGSDFCQDCLRKGFDSLIAENAT